MVEGDKWEMYIPSELAYTAKVARRPRSRAGRRSSSGWKLS
jgi:FKBP-type peptidyl-prolyl cis-trans isomerase